MIYTGGLRLRLIKDSFYYMLKDSMDQLGWFDSKLANKPVTLIPAQLQTNVEIKPNVVGISSEGITEEELEMGSSLARNNWEIYIDILAEDEAVGIHLSGDIFDILRGKISAIGRTGPTLDVMDLPPNNDEVVFRCEIENIVINRARDWDTQHNKFWWVVGCEVIDTYYNDETQ